METESHSTPPAPFAPAQSIDEVVERLREIVSDSREHGSRHGWFASLYLRTTLRVRNGIHVGRFEDSERMERFDVRFANRYLHADHLWSIGRTPTRAWRLAFEREDEPDHLVLQHLILGMNAHINLDLGIAACSTCPGPELLELEADFFEINRVLAEMIDAVQVDLAEISPLLGWVDRMGGRADELLVAAFLRRSRAAAWMRATHLAPLYGMERTAAIDRFDRFTSRLGRRVCPPRVSQPSWLRAVRSREQADVDAVYEVLESAG